MIWGRETILHGQSARTVLLVRAVVPSPSGSSSSGFLVICHPRQARPGATSSNLKIATVMLGRLQLHPTPLSTFFPAGPPPTTELQVDGRESSINPGSAWDTAL